MHFARNLPLIVGFEHLLGHQLAQLVVDVLHARVVKVAVEIVFDCFAGGFDVVAGTWEDVEQEMAHAFQVKAVSTQRDFQKASDCSLDSTALASTLEEDAVNISVFGVFDHPQRRVTLFASWLKVEKLRLYSKRHASFDGLQLVNNWRILRETRLVQLDVFAGADEASKGTVPFASRILLSFYGDAWKLWSFDRGSKL